MVASDGTENSRAENSSTENSRAYCETQGNIFSSIDVYIQLLTDHLVCLVAGNSLTDELVQD